MSQQPHLSAADNATAIGDLSWTGSGDPRLPEDTGEAREEQSFEGKCPHPSLLHGALLPAGPHASTLGTGLSNSCLHLETQALGNKLGGFLEAAASVSSSFPGLQGAKLPLQLWSWEAAAVVANPPRLISWGRGGGRRGDRRPWAHLGVVGWWEGR